MPAATAADRPVRITFVCTGNTGRSVTAAALANAYAGQHRLPVEALSRATTLDPDHTRPEAIFVALLAERGIDSSSARATQFGTADAEGSDVVLAMTRTHLDWLWAQFPRATGKMFTLAEYAGGVAEEVPDAFGKPADVYAQVLAQLDRLVPAAVRRAATKR